MRTIVNSPIRRPAHAARLGLAAAAVVALAGCKGLLDVSNPGAVDAGQLTQPAYLNLMTDGVRGEFQQMMHWDGVYAATFSGEVTNHHVYYEEGDISRRDILSGTLYGIPVTTNGTYTLAVYNAIHRTRWLADSVAARVKSMLGDSAKRDLRLAKVLMYAGFSYAYLGEQLCSSPINVSKMYTSDEILAMAPSRFDEAITVATAAKAWAAAYTPDAYWSAAMLTAYQAGADTVIQASRIGAARAYLDLNNKAQAITYAGQVTSLFVSDKLPGFILWSYYMDTSAYDNQWWYRIALAAGSGNRTASLIGTPYDGVVDPRIPQQKLNVMDGYNSTVKPIPGVNVPKSTPAFSTYDGTVLGAEVAKNSYLRIASSIEARYILAEAQGKSGPGNIDFLNARRALAGMAPVDASISDTDYRNAVIEQRTRDLYLDGHRLGDIRRYKKYYNLDFYLHGKFPTSTTLQYGTLECFPLPQAEVQGYSNLWGGS